MFQAIAQRLSVKLGLLATVAVAAGFSLALTLSTDTLLKSTARLHAQAADGIVASIGAAVRTTMLAGDSVHLRRLVEEVKKRLPQVGVRFFSIHGQEVFGPKPPAPPADQVPLHVRSALATGKPTENEELQALPVANGERCSRCHGREEVLGVLSVGGVPTGKAGHDQNAALEAFPAVIRDGFYRIMMVPSAQRMEKYFAELTRQVPGLRSVAVYGPEGRLAYGKPASAGGKLVLRVTPLRNEARCAGCHEDAEVNGSRLEVGFDPGTGSANASLAPLVGAALTEVMAAGLGRLTTDFLDDISRTGTLSHLTLHDAQGRLVHDAFVPPSPPAAVAQVLRTGTAPASTVPEAPEIVFIKPLPNEPACQTCHGLVGPILGAVEIRLNTGEEQTELSALRRNSAFYGVSTIALVLALLALGLYYAVIRPVREIGAVADLVGAGQLDTNVDIHSSDEMGRLGRRINDMVLGLRQKIELSKFVSRDTLHEVESSAGTVARHGEKRRIAVLFSDIRGFTMFTESHEPEEVVGMLNRCLQVQAEVALRHGGDIDKFVGDEIMVRFDGPDMALRATRAAVEMAEVVTQLNLRQIDPTQGTAVGVGVSVGDAVLGAMGAERRMDFTAIGDAVNLGARLCSAAGRGEVLISEAVRIEIGDAQGLVFTPLDPIMVKGKHDPITIYRAQRALGG